MKTISLIVDILASVKLTIVLLIMITGAAIVGSLFPYISPRFAAMDPFASWWFNLLLVLLMINLIVCSVKKFPLIRAAANPSRKPFSEDFVTGLENSSTISSPMPLGEAMDRIARRLGKAGYHLTPPDEDPVPGKQERADNAVLLLGERGAGTRYYFYITHLSLLFLFLGAIIGALWGFKGYLQLEVGQESDMVIEQGSHNQTRLPYVVRCDDFSLIHYDKSDQVSDYVSKLTLSRDGNTLFQSTIRVNHPLTWEGITFYQSSYGQTMFRPERDSVDVFIHDRESDRELVHQRVSLEKSYEFSIGDDKRSFSLLDFVPDFVMDQSGKVGTRSMAMNNPAVLVRISDAEGQHQDVFWSFAKFPDLMMGKRHNNVKFVVKFPETKAYTGLQVVKDPGVPFIYIGGLMLSLGIMLVLFSASHRRVFLYGRQERKKSVISVGIKASRNRMALRQDFVGLVAQLEAEVNNVK